MRAHRLTRTDKQSPYEPISKQKFQISGQYVSSKGGTFYQQMFVRKKAI